MGTIHSMRQSWSVNNLIDFAVRSIQRAQAGDSPFYHLRFDRVFPDDFYAAMLEAMPGTDDYRALSGKAKLRNRTPDGQPTRAKIDLFPEYVRHLPQKKRAVWDIAGRVLRSKELEKVFVERLAPGLKRRFGANFAKVRMYPVPILTRDVPGYYITATRTRFGRASQSSFICRQTIRRRILVPFFTRCCRMPVSRKGRRCYSRLIPATRLRLAIIPGIRSAWLGRRLKRETAFCSLILSMLGLRDFCAIV